MDIVERIAQLRKMVPDNGATEDEALAALNMADKLMQKHGITENDLRKVEFSRDMKQDHFKQRQKVQHPSTKFCGMKIAAFCGVKSWYSNSQNRAEFFGLKEDVDMAQFLTQLIHDSMDRSWKEYLIAMPKGASGSSRHTEYWSFMMGFAGRINKRMEELTQSRAQPTGTDLVVLKNALVEEAVKVMLPSLQLRKATFRLEKANATAVVAGRTAGDRVNLNRPLSGASKGGRKLIA
jgi:hypothetical protein